MSNSQEWMNAHATHVEYVNTGLIHGDDYDNDAPALTLDCGSGCEIIIEGSRENLLALATRIMLAVSAEPVGEAVERSECECSDPFTASLTGHGHGCPVSS